MANHTTTVNQGPENAGAGEHSATVATQAEAFSRALEASPSPLREYRQAAYRAFLEAGLPHGKSEDYTYVRVSEFLPFLAAEAVAFPPPGHSPGTPELPGLRD